MRPEADVYSYVQDLEKHLQMTSFGGMADPEWAFEGRCGHDLMLPRGRYTSHRQTWQFRGPRVSPAAVA